MVDHHPDIARQHVYEFVHKGLDRPVARCRTWTIEDAQGMIEGIAYDLDYAPYDLFVREAIE